MIQFLRTQKLALPLYLGIILELAGLEDEDQLANRWAKSFQKIRNANEEDQIKFAKSLKRTCDSLILDVLRQPKMILEIGLTDIRTTRIEYNFMAEKLNDKRSRFLAEEFNKLADDKLENSAAATNIYLKAAKIK